MSTMGRIRVGVRKSRSGRYAFSINCITKLDCKCKLMDVVFEDITTINLGSLL